MASKLDEVDATECSTSQWWRLSLILIRLTKRTTILVFTGYWATVPVQNVKWWIFVCRRRQIVRVEHLNPLLLTSAVNVLIQRFSINQVYLSTSTWPLKRNFFEVCSVCTRTSVSVSIGTRWIWFARCSKWRMRKRTLLRRHQVRLNARQEMLMTLSSLLCSRRTIALHGRTSWQLKLMLHS